MSRSKAIGTAAETAVTRYANSLGIPARRVALAGAADHGDVWLWPVGGGARVCVEVKAGAKAAAPSWLLLEQWQAEAELESSRVNDCDVAVLVCKRRGSGLANAGDWHAWVRADDIHRGGGVLPWTMWRLADLLHVLIRLHPGWGLT